MVPSSLLDRYGGGVEKSARLDPRAPQREHGGIAAIIEDGDRRSRLHRIMAPTLVIHGREDPLVRLAGGIDTAENIPGARLEIIDGMGHNLPETLVPRLVELIAVQVGQDGVTSSVAV